MEGLIYQLPALAVPVDPSHSHGAKHSFIFTMSENDGIQNSGQNLS